MSAFKLLLAGAVLGLMAVFAFIGVKSLIDGQNTGGQQQALQQQPAQIPPPTLVDENNNQTLADQAIPQATQADTTQLTPSAQDNGQQQAATQDSSSAEQANNTANNTQSNQNNQNSQSQQQTTEPTEQTATQSTEEEEKLDMQLIDEYGGLQLTLSDPAAPNRQVKGQFVIRDAQDQVVANINDADTASFDLSPGFYEVTVIADDKKSARMVRIVTGEFVTENFILPSATPQPVPQQATQQTGQQQTAPQGTGRLSVSVRAATTKAPLKSNIYVQLPNGQHIAKKNYAEAAEFVLRPGDYKVTVKTQGKVDIVRNIGIRANGNVQQVFEMKSPAAQAPAQPAPPPEGTLRMALRAPAGQNLSRGRFVVRDAQGNRVKRMRGVSNAEVKLKPGRYEVTAVHLGSRLDKQVNVAQGKTSNVTFNISDFPRNPPPAQNQNAPQQAPQQQQVQVPAQQGVLQLIAVSGVNGQPLKVNFLVSTLNGQRLKTAENVSVTEVTMPPQDVLVDINYEEMRGQERITVKAGEPTVFTFTISPNNANNAAPITQTQPEAPRSLEDMLLERLQQEIFQRMN